MNAGKNVMNVGIFVRNGGFIFKKEDLYASFSLLLAV